MSPKSKLLQIFKRQKQCVSDFCRKCVIKAGLSVVCGKSIINHAAAAVSTHVLVMRGSTLLYIQPSPEVLIIRI